MNTFPKLPGKPECLGFRKTVVLNLEEYVFLKNSLSIAIDLTGNTSAKAILEKLNAPTPPPN